MKTILALAVIAILVSVSTLVVTENIDARTRVSGSVVPVSSSGFDTAVCGPDAIHICQTAG
ncbi:MAG: hypothetical protein WBL67_00900 [Nitrososphaeraceae archaeon]